MQKLDKRNQRLKITISTRKKYLSSIQRGISEFIGNPEYDLEYHVSVKDIEASAGDDPIVMIVS